ncbi:MAG: helix-turn-helix domain-containing protein [Armatimonadota bacterium]
MSKPDCLTMKIPEAARFLGIGESQLRQLVRTGVIPHTRFGKVYLFTREGLTDFIHQQEEQSTYVSSALSSVTKPQNARRQRTVRPVRL